MRGQKNLQDAHTVCFQGYIKPPKGILREALSRQPTSSNQQLHRRLHSSLPGAYSTSRILQTGGTTLIPTQDFKTKITILHHGNTIEALGYHGWKKALV